MIECIALGVGFLAVVLAVLLMKHISGLDAGTEVMKEIASAIHEGALTFLNREYRTLSIFIIVVSAVLGIAGFAVFKRYSVHIDF